MTARNETTLSQPMFCDSRPPLPENRLPAPRMAAVKESGPGIRLGRARPHVIPLSCAQQRLWFLDRLEPGSAVHNLCRALRLTGPLHVSALEWSLNEIIRRHEI